MWYFSDHNSSRIRTLAIEWSSINTLYVILHALCTHRTHAQPYDQPDFWRVRDTKSQESSAVESINQHENKQSYNLKKLLMKAINKAFYKSAVHAHTHERHSTWSTCVSHQMPEWLLFTHCKPSLSVCVSCSHLLSLSLFKHFFPPAQWPSSQAQPSFDTHSLTHSFYQLPFIPQKGSDCYYSCIQITYILLPLSMTKIQGDSTQT